MTGEELKALVQDAGGPEHVTGLYFDNALTFSFQYRADGTREPFRLEDIRTIGGVDYYIATEKYRAKSIFGGDYTIPAKQYHPLDCLQGVGTIDSLDDLKKVDPDCFWDLH